MSGRPSLPAELHLIRGNPSKKNVEELRSTSGLFDKLDLSEVEPPAHLSELGKFYYIEISKKLVGTNVLSSMDTLALELLIEAYQEYREHSAYLEENGYSYQTTNTMGDVSEKPYPQAAMKADAWRRVAAMLQQFGWTPSSRSKVKGVGNSDPIKKSLGNRGK
ncbi:terminase small subunit [Dickeya phage Sucellus]|nr:terminase small subunit [Dickeya phage Sucellus]